MTIQRSAAKRPASRFAQIIDRWFWVVMVAVVIGAFVGWQMFLFTPASTESRADLFIAQRPNPSHSLATEMQILASRSNIEHALSADLNLDDERQLVGRSPREVVDWIEQRLKVVPRSEDLLRVSLATESAELSDKIVDRLVSGYQESIASRAQSDSAIATTLPPVVVMGRQSLPGHIGWLGLVARGAGLGLLLGCCLAGLLEIADRRFRSPADIEHELNLPVLGHVPSFHYKATHRENVEASLVVVHHPRGRAAESYRWIRTKVLNHPDFLKKRVLQIASPIPGDGKSTLAANLALCIAESGKRVLLIDCDLRRPVQRLLFMSPNSDEGLSEVIRGHCQVEDCIKPTCRESLSLLPSGRRTSNPSEMLSSNRFREVLNYLRSEYDTILIDTPSMLACSDALAVAAVADGVLLTLKLNSGARGLSVYAINDLRTVNANVLGVVVNGAEPETHDAYNYWRRSYVERERDYYERLNALDPEPESETPAELESEHATGG